MANAITGLPANDSLLYEVIWKPLVENPKINALPFDIIFGKIGKEIYFDTEFDGDPSEKTGCGWTFIEGSAITKKKLDPKELDCSIKQCYTDLLKSIFGDKLPDGHKRGELYPEIIGRINEKQVNLFNERLIQLVFLGDTAKTGYISTLDGVLKKLQTGIANGDGTVDGGTITASDLSLANVENTIYTKFIEPQSQLLKAIDNSQKKLIVTQSVFEAYARFLQASSSAFQYTNAQAIQEGITNVKHSGIELINANWIDRGLKRYFPTSPASVLNYGVLTVPSNHKIMIDGNGFEQIDPQYILNDDEVISPLTAMVDYEYGFGELNVFAGGTGA